MIHYLWTGHFDEEGGHVRFVRVGEPRETFQPVIRRPLEAAAIEAVLREVGGDHLTLSTIPRDWSITLGTDGVLVSDEYTRSREAIDFVARLAERTGAQIWADGGQRKLSPQTVMRDWVARWERLLRHRNRPSA